MTHAVDIGRHPALPPLLQPGATCWRVERSDRVAFIVDAAAYFRAAKAAMRKARHSILILGWDFDPRIRLEPDNCKAEPPDELGTFLKSLVSGREDLHIHVLIWDMALPISISRRLIPKRARNWLQGERLQYRLDRAHPVGACHHQKLLVVDDAMAFCGGMDFAGNRWDTPAHADPDPHRRTPDGATYEPRHDVMMAVDGAAAAALGELCRERWRRATGLRPASPPTGSDVWPEGLRADLTGVPVGIARTEPAWNGRPAKLENEALYLKAIGAARRWIYLESQYFASSAVGDALAARLAEPDGPEVVVVCSLHSPSYFDRLVMDPAREVLSRCLRAADGYGRFRLYAPLAADGTPIIVHSKVTVVDDRLLRIGSANLNNRSMGFDTECDLAVEAAAGEPYADHASTGFRRFLDRLLAEHLGVPVDQVSAALTRSGSLIASVEMLNREFGRRLRPIEGPEAGGIGSVIGISHLMDPGGTADAWQPWKRYRKERRTPRPRL